MGPIVTKKMSYSESKLQLNELRKLSDNKLKFN